jgi:hypothetical protein
MRSVKIFFCYILYNKTTMGGGLMQLVAYGAQDIYLTGNPQITFWKVMYRRHTNFSMESIEQTFNGAADWGRKVTCTISRNGDLISRVYLQVTLPSVTVTGVQRFRWLNWLGHVMIKQVEVEIGGQRIDRHYGDWMHIWNELTQTAGHAAGYASMVGNVPRLVQPINAAGQAPAANPNDFAFGTVDTTAAMPEVTLYVPLEFWFCRNPGLALPLIALQYHEVKINLEFREASGCYWSEGGVVLPSLKAASLYVDYVYLDTDERRRFAQVSHEYLIEQLQFTGDESVSSTANKIKLNFNHPVKELIWVVQPETNVDAAATQAVGGIQWFNYTDALDTSALGGTPDSPLGTGISSAANAAAINNLVTIAPTANAAAANAANLSQATGSANGITFNLLDRGDNPVASAKLQLNGHDRFSERDGRYFNLVQPYQHHSNCPATGINVYSFGLKPEDHQPSGTCNMSRIDNATLQLNLTARAVRLNNAPRSCKVRVYATNYNVLRIMSGINTCAQQLAALLAIACLIKVNSVKAIRVY